MAELDPMFVQVRNKALAWRDPEAPPGSPSGIVMETGYPEGVVMLVVMSSGTVDLFFSGGGAVMGAGRQAGPAQAARELAQMAMRGAQQLPIVTEAPLPPLGVVSLYVLMDGLVRGVSGKEKDFGEGRLGASPLFHAAHRVIKEIREAPPPQEPPQF